MRKLGYIKSRAVSADNVIDDLTITFNVEKTNRQSMTYKDMQIVATIDGTTAELNFFGVLIFEYDDGVNEDKPQYIGMPKGVDPKKPETWQGLVTHKTVWDKDRFADASVSLPETPGRTEEQK